MFNKLILTLLLSLGLSASALAAINCSEVNLKDKVFQYVDMDDDYLQVNSNIFNNDQKILAFSPGEATAILIDNEQEISLTYSLGNTNSSNRCVLQLSNAEVNESFELIAIIGTKEPTTMYFGDANQNNGEIFFTLEAL